MNGRTTVLVVGATGRLGNSIASYLLEGEEAEVRALARPGTMSDGQKAQGLREAEARGLVVVEGDLFEPGSLPAVCEGVDTIVSAINGDHRSVVDGQKNLIAAAEEAGVQRMIPSDYSVDYFKIDYGDNDFLDMRKEVAQALEESDVAPTFVLNGSFIDVATARWWWQFDLEEGTFSYYGDGDQPCDFTAISDVARYVAAAATDPHMADRDLKVAGEVLTMKQILSAYNAATGRNLREKRLGSTDDLKGWIKQTKQTASSPMEYVFQQYHWAMVSGKGKLDRLDNDRYPDIKPTGVEQFVRAT